MVLKIISLICVTLFFFALGVFEVFVITHLREIKAKTDNLPNSKHHWSMGVYMNDIPQNEQNTARIIGAPLKIYEGRDYLELPVPRKGEKISGVYNSGENRFKMTGIVEDVFYNTDIDWIVVECKCTNICKI